MFYHQNTQSVSFQSYSTIFYFKNIEGEREDIWKFAVSDRKRFERRIKEFEVLYQKIVKKKKSKEDMHINSKKVLYM